LTEKIDLITVTSVVSNVSATPVAQSIKSPAASTDTLTANGNQTASTKITIHGSVPMPKSPPVSPAIGPETERSGEPAIAKEYVLLTLQPASQTLASEFLDGLLMLLNQAPITADTNRLVKAVTEYGMKIRLLNVRLDRPIDKALGEVPTREGLDEEYFYDVFGG